MTTTTYSPQSYIKPLEIKPLTLPDTKYLSKDRLMALLGDFTANAIGGLAGEIWTATRNRTADPIENFFSFYEDYQLNPSGFAETEYTKISLQQLMAAFTGMAKLLPASKLDVEPIPSVYPEGNIAATWNLGKMQNLSIEFYDDQTAVCVLRCGSDFETLEWNVESSIPDRLREFLSPR